MSANNASTGRRLAICTLAGASLATMVTTGVRAQSYDLPPPDYSGPAYNQVYDAPTNDVPTAGEVIVRAPRHQRRDTATGAPIERVYASRVVRYDDLDLSTRSGVHVLKVRIDNAARAACDELDARYTVVDDRQSCVSRATRDALYETPLGAE